MNLVGQNHKTIQINRSMIKTLSITVTKHKMSVVSQGSWLWAWQNDLVTHKTCSHKEDRYHSCEEPIKQFVLLRPKTWPQKRRWKNGTTMFLEWLHKWSSDKKLIISFVWPETLVLLNSSPRVIILTHSLYLCPVLRTNTWLWIIVPDCCVAFTTELWRSREISFPICHVSPEQNRKMEWVIYATTKLLKIQLASWSYL